MERGGDIEDLAARLFKLFESGAADVECAFRIDIDDGAETIGRQLVGGGEEVAGSSIDDNVDLSIMLDRSSDGIFNRGLVTHIRRYGETLTAGVFDRLLHRF